MYLSPTINWVIKSIRMYEGDTRCTQNFGEKPQEKRPLGTPRHRWENNIEMNLQKMG